MGLILRWLEDTVPSRLEVTTRHDLQCFTNVDDKTSGSVWHVVPPLVLPDLETGDRNGKQEGGQPKVGVSVHFQAFGGILSGFLDGAEDGVAEVAFASCRSFNMGLNVVPEVIVVQLEHSGEESEYSAIHRLCEILSMSSARAQPQSLNTAGARRQLTLENASISSMNGLTQVGTRLWSCHSLVYQLNCSIPSLTARCRCVC